MCMSPMGHEGHDDPEPTALKILKRRLARGEIKPEEYARLRALIAEDALGDEVKEQAHRQ